MKLQKKGKLLTEGLLVKLQKRGILDGKQNLPSNNRTSCTRDNGPGINKHKCSTWRGMILLGKMIKGNLLIGQKSF